MRTYEISSPGAAELYFSNSFVGDVASLVRAALAGFGGDRGNVQRTGRRTTARAGMPKQSLLDRLDAWFWRQEQKAQEDYLAGARDVYDLERRIDALDRGSVTRYY
ncbi:MAG TPA: DUF3563 family protein [Casimicrobiaceae bacterium]|nr:DUF3563 family protein [Casimicrobiaceae bacterium]